IHSAPSDVLEELKLRLQLKDRLFQEVLSDRTRQAQEHQDQVQSLLTALSSRDQYIQDSASRLGEVMAEQTSRLQELRRQLSSGVGLRADAGPDLAAEVQVVQEELRLALRREKENQELSRSQAARLDSLTRTLQVKEEIIRDFQRQMVDPSGLPLVERLTQEVQELRESLVQQEGPPTRGPLPGRDRPNSRQPEFGDLSSEEEDEADDEDLNSEYTESVDEDKSNRTGRSQSVTSPKDLLLEGQGLMEVKQLVEQKRAVERQLGELKAQLEKAGFSSLSQMSPQVFLFHLSLESTDQRGAEKSRSTRPAETLHLLPPSSPQVDDLDGQEGAASSARSERTVRLQQKSKELQERLMVSEATVQAQAEQLKDYRELLTETTVQQDSKQIQVDLQDLGYETCGRSENEAEREDTSSPEFDDLEMCTSLDCGSQWWPSTSTSTTAAPPTTSSSSSTFTKPCTTQSSGYGDEVSSLQRLVEDLRSQLSRSQAASPSQSGTEDDEGWQSSDGGPLASPRHPHPDKGLQELVSRVDALENQLRKGGKKSVDPDGKSATWPGKFDTLIQTQARELSHLRQRLREGRGVCNILTQHLGDTTKAFEELLRANDIDYYMGQSFRDQLAQSGALAQRVAAKISGREHPEDPDEKTELLAIRFVLGPQQICDLRYSQVYHQHCLTFTTSTTSITSTTTSTTSITSITSISLSQSSLYPSLTLCLLLLCTCSCHRGHDLGQQANEPCSVSSGDDATANESYDSQSPKTRSLRGGGEEEEEVQGWRRWGLLMAPLWKAMLSKSSPLYRDSLFSFSLWEWKAQERELLLLRKHTDRERRALLAQLDKLSKELQQKDKVIESLRAKLNQHHHHHHHSHRSDTPCSSHALSDITDQSDRISYVSDEHGSTNEELELCSDVDGTSELGQEDARTSSRVGTDCHSHSSVVSCHPSVPPSITSSHRAQSCLSCPSMHCPSSPHKPADMQGQTAPASVLPSAPLHLPPPLPPPTQSATFALSNSHPTVPLRTRYHGSSGGAGFSLAEVHQELQMLQRQLGDRFSTPQSKPLQSFPFAHQQSDPSAFLPLSFHGYHQPSPFGSAASSLDASLAMKAGASLLESSALWDVAYGPRPVSLGAELSSGSSGYQSGASHTGSDLMKEHLREVRSLRQRLEDSIQTNDRLRQQLEDRLARTATEKGNHTLQTGSSSVLWLHVQEKAEHPFSSLLPVPLLSSAPTNIYIQGLDSVGQLSSEIRLLKEENMSLLNQLKQVTREGSKEVDQLREAALQDRARLKEAELEVERWAEQSRKLQTEADAHNQEMAQLKQERQRNQETINRLQHEVSVLQQQLCESRSLVHSLQCELQVYHRVGGVTTKTHSGASMPHGKVPDGSFSSRHGRHVVGHVDDFKALQQQILEGGALLRKMEAALRSLIPSDSSSARKLLSDTKTLRQILEEADSLLRMFWRAALPNSEETKQDQALREEVVSLRHRLSEQEQALKDAMERVKSSNRTKDSMEHFIVSQRDVEDEGRVEKSQDELTGELISQVRGAFCELAVSPGWSVVTPQTPSSSAAPAHHQRPLEAVYL
ncbi:hypothetical protein INR49_011941, partial [Caranx melampygus]